jgi:hypothetical protein
VLKFILLTVAIGISNFSYAQSSSKSCVSDLMYNFRATATEANQICSINSSAVFLKCMDHKLLTTQLDVHSAAVQCDSKFKRVQQEPTNQYVNFNSCSARLQVGARMSPRRSVEICDWDSSEVMMSCLIQIVQKAGWHSEHAIQYCDFANQNYRKHIPRFVKCVTTHPLRSKSVEQTAQACHDSILDIIIPLAKPRVKNERPPVTVTTVEQTPHVTVETKTPDVVVVEPQRPVVTIQDQTENKKVVTETVPTPIKIQVQESAKPEEIVDQPVEKDSTSNSEVLPLD